MRYSELLETRVYRIPASDGGVIHVMHNPSKQAFEKFAAQRGNNLRGLISFEGNDLYLWDAGSAVHGTVRDELGLERVEYLAWHNNRWFGPNLVDDTTGLYQPAIQRITPRKAPSWTPEDEKLLKDLLGDDLK